MVARARVDRSVLVRRLLHRVSVLHVVGDDDRGDRPLGERDPERAIDKVTDLSRLHRHLDELVGDVLEQRRQVDFLLVVAANPCARLLTDDRHHRLMVELCVIETVEQMDRAGTGGRHADPGFAGELGMRTRHERRHLLVPGLDELGTLRAIARAAERADDPVDPVPGISVDPLDAPCGETLEKVVAHGLAHMCSAP